jgi:DNA-binding Lrp family transcriptional regulator
MKINDKITAYVLIKTELGKADTIASEILKLPGVLKATVVAGEYDIIVELLDTNIEEVLNKVVRGIQEIPDVKETKTFIGTKMFAPIRKGRL